MLSACEPGTSVFGSGSAKSNGEKLSTRIGYIVMDYVKGDTLDLISERKNHG
jgi:hypothetical protein